MNLYFLLIRGHNPLNFAMQNHEIEAVNESVFMYHTTDDFFNACFYFYLNKSTAWDYKIIYIECIHYKVFHF